MGTGEHSSSLSAESLASFEATLDGVRRRVHRVLHDEAGPSLCAAGLQLDLLLSTTDAADRAEAASGLREALDAAMHALRALMVESDPNLLARSGLDGALTALARSLPLNWQEPSTPCPLDGPQAALCYRIAREWAAQCAAAHPPQTLRLRREGAELHLAAPPAPLPWLPACRVLAAAAGIAIHCEETGPDLKLRLAPAS